MDIAGDLALQVVFLAMAANRVGSLVAIGVDEPEGGALWREVVVESGDGGGVAVGGGAVGKRLGTQA